MLVRNPGKAQTALRLHNVPVTSVEIVEADLTDHSALRSGLGGVDAVVHSAAVFSLSPLDGRSMLEVNPASTEAILAEAAALRLDPIVYVSTAGAFMPLTGDPINAESPLSEGCGPYTRSKIAAEHIARRYQAQGQPVVCIYPGGVIGPRDPNADLSDSMALVTLIVKRNTALMPGGARLSIVDVRDVAKACVGSLEAGRGPRRYHLWGEPAQLEEMVGIVSEVTGREIRFRQIPLSVVDVAGWVAELTTRATRVRLPLCVESARLFTQNARSGGPGRIDEAPAQGDFGFPEYTLTTSLR
ncbi:uncharacterized protein METZ01_LOCUS375578, partial [marine metagenome]